VEFPPFPDALYEQLHQERTLALHAVLSARDAADGDNEINYEYFLRSVFRWYGKTFSIPPHEVEKLPLADVVRCYWEHYYEKLASADKDAELADEARLLSEEPKKRRRREEAERVKKVEDDRWHAAEAARAIAARKKALEKLGLRPDGSPDPQSAVKQAVQMSQREPIKLLFDTSEEDMLGSADRPRK
jgi:hypothetical protein